VEIDDVFAADDGPIRTAALVAWVQGLFVEDGTIPVLVGGAAVELYTTGAYTTGDVDLVGHVTAGAARALSAAGFTRRGRHWIHEAAQVFIEFPGSALDPEEESDWYEVAGQRIHIISVEDLLVDRLGAWEHWKSSVDGVNAFLLWRGQQDRIDRERLERRIARVGWHKALQSLIQYSKRWEHSDPSMEEVEQWATAGP
jgi:hypothetical protein